MKFNDIIGQKDIKNHMQKALEQNQISHAYIINGERESGKMMLAQAFVQALFCENGTSEACGECPSCKKVEHKNHPDVIYVTHDNPKLIKVDDIREQLVEDMYIKPYSSSRKVYIVEDAELMGEAAQNALLKSLEEPPEYVTILLLTANVSALLDTILSRCILLNIRPVVEEREKVERILTKTYQMPDYEAEEIMNLAQGNVGKAFALASDEEFRNLMDRVLNMVIKVSACDSHEISQMAEKLQTEEKEGIINLKDYFDLLEIWYRDVLLYKSTASQEHIYFKNRLLDVKKQAKRGDYAKINDVLKKIEESRSQIRLNIDKKSVLITLMHEMKEI